MTDYDVIIIGAGPAGTSCAALLHQQGKSCLIIEKSIFPRFCIGESLLPQNMEFYKQCGLEHVFQENKFPYKDGAEFLCGEQTQTINFKDKSSLGPWSTFQVPRDKFDMAIVNSIENLGVKIKFGALVKSILINEKVTIQVEQDNNIFQITSSFIVDASGLGKVLPRLLNIKTDYSQEDRFSLFTHIQTSDTTHFDNNKILITIDEHDTQTWFWTIPLGDKRYSMGVITKDAPKDLTNDEALMYFITRNKSLERTLGFFTPMMPVKKLQSFTSKSEKLYGEKFVLIGNSGEFLDPIFSSGVTVALKTATLSAPLIIKKLNNENVNWEKEYILPLQKGIDTFKTFVNSWYKGDLQKIIFTPHVEPTIRSHIISILAGYVWDEKNPYTQKSKARLQTLSDFLSTYKGSR